jgi:hypothetical protein
MSYTRSTLPKHVQEDSFSLWETDSESEEEDSESEVESDSVSLWETDSLWEEEDSESEVKSSESSESKQLVIERIRNWLDEQMAAADDWKRTLTASTKPPTVTQAQAQIQAQSNNNHLESGSLEEDIAIKQLQEDWRKVLQSGAMAPGWELPPFHQNSNPRDPPG